MNLRRGAGNNRLLPIAAVTSALLLVGGMAFGAVARAYAAASIPQGQATSEAAPSAGASSAPSSAPRPVTDALGIRVLPLLTDEIRESWTAEPDATLAKAQSKVLGDSSPIVVSTIEQSMASLDYEYPRGYPFDLAPVARLIADRLNGSADVTQGDVLNLVGLLELKAVDRTRESGNPDQSLGVLAFLLADFAATRYASCDALLAKAHAQSLWWQEIDGSVDRAFDVAVGSCPSDPTAALESAYWQLTKSITGDCEALGNVPIQEWGRLARNFEVVQAKFPSSAAGYVGTADLYRIAGNIISLWGVAPFTAREYRSRALELYQRAAALSSSPYIDLSLARLELEAGDPDAAAARMSNIPEWLASSSTALDLSALIAAERGSFQLAATQQVRADAVVEPLVQQIHNGAPSEAFSVREITGAAMARSGDFGHFGGECGGSLVEDRSYVPNSRVTEFNPRYAYVMLAQDWVAGESMCVDPNSVNEDECGVIWARGEATALSDNQLDVYQDSYRRYGALARAGEVVTAWVEARPESALAFERLGEVRFLQKRWAESQRASEQAAQLYSGYLVDDGYDPEFPQDVQIRTGPGWALLRQAVAARELGDRDGALDILSRVASGTEDEPLSGTYRDRLLLMYAYQELGLTELRNGDNEAALEHLALSIDLGVELEASPGRDEPVLRGAQAQAASEAALALGRNDEADAFAQQALSIDPESPLFRETAGEANRAADRPAAIAAYRSALANDPTLFSSWNNLAVLLYQTGHPDEAVSALERAVSVRPDYALGWFNLGVIESERPGSLSFLRAEGALGKAGSIDTTLKSEDPVVQLDLELYESGVDVSKQIPADWQLTRTARSSPQLLGVGVLVMLAARVGWALSSDWLVQHGVVFAVGRRPRGLRWFAKVSTARPAAIWTTACSMAVLIYLSGASGAYEVVAGALLVGALLGAHWLAQRLADPSGSVRSASSIPASVSTLALAPLGFGFTPPAPIANSDAELPASVRRSGVAVLGVAVLSLALVAWLTAVPVTRIAALAGLLVLSSALVPVHPLDGARLQLGRALEVIVSLALAGATVLVTIGFL